MAGWEFVYGYDDELRDASEQFLFPATFVITD